MSYSLDVVVQASVERVWDSWASEKEAKLWLASDAHVEFVEGGAYEFFWDEDHDKDSTIGCKLITIKRHQRIVFEWQGKTEFLHLFMAPNKRTRIEVKFERLSSGVRVNLAQAETRESLDWEQYEKWMKDAWVGALQSLIKHCENPR